MVDMVLKEVFMESITTSTSQITETLDYKMLKNITDIKLKNRGLTLFRQNNEVNVQNLKRIIKYIVDSYTQECVPYKVLAFDIQEIMKLHLNQVVANLTLTNFEMMTSLPTSQI